MGVYAPISRAIAADVAAVFFSPMLVRELAAWLAVNWAVAFMPTGFLSSGTAAPSSPRNAWRPMATGLEPRLPFASLTVSKLSEPPA